MARWTGEGVGQGVAANVAFSATCAVCTVFGWSQIPDPNDPKNWPIWVAVLIAFGILTSLGAGANAARLWWKKHKIAVASLERFTVILADIIGDDPNRSQKRNIRDTLKH